jgi:ACS family hexuronate transporter-like MFS transporter
MLAQASRLPRASWSVAVVAAFALTASYIDRQALSLLAPTVRDALGINHFGYGALTGAFSLAFLIGAPVAGRFVDRLGARSGLALALVVWSVVSGLHGMASSFAALFVLRVALGATAAPSLPGAARAVRRVLPPGSRSTGYSLLFTGSSLGAVLAAPLVISLKMTFGWQLAFVGTSLIGLAWLPIWLLATRGSHSTLRPHGEPRQRAEDVPWGEIFGERSVQRALVLVFLSAPAVMFVYNWYAQLLVERLYEGQNDIWRYLWAPPLMFEVGAVGAGWIIGERRSEGKSRALVFLGALLVGALAYVPYVNDALMATVLACVAMVGAGAIHVLATTDMLARVPAHMAMRAGGATASGQALAYVFSAPIVGAVLDRSQSYTPVMYAVGLLALPGAILWVLWPSSTLRSSEAKAG